MKRVLSLVITVLMLLSLVACASNNKGDETDMTTKNIGDDTTTVDNIESSSEDITTKDDNTSTEETTVAPDPIPSSIKILTIGNSFSVDAMEYLWAMLSKIGVKNITLGNMYVGGCTLKMHCTYALNDQPEYVYYYTNSNGAWKNTKNYKLSTALALDDWDYIVMQESSKVCGILSAYEESLETLVSYVEERCPNAKLIWHMTWAYQQDSTHSAFPKYDNDQMKMYNMTVDCVENYVMNFASIKGCIPSGTSIQNARTSFLGDTLTRDGYHLDKTIGRYIAALTWASFFTGVSPYDVDYNISELVISEDMLAAAKEAVANALEHPFEVTQSTVLEGTRP